MSFVEVGFIASVLSICINYHAITKMKSKNFTVVKWSAIMSNEDKSG